MSSTTPSISQQISVLLADDSKVMLEAIRELLQTEPRISILGEPTNFTDLAKMVVDLKPKVAVIDVHMPGKGQANWDDLKRSLVNCSLIAISLWDDAPTRGLAGAIGAVEFFSKSTVSTELIPAILRLGLSGQSV